MNTQNLQKQGSNEFVRTYVWEIPVRLAHWSIAFALILLCVTGIHLHNPSASSQNGCLWGLGRTRRVHELSGLLLVAALLLRFYWFRAGTKWARLPAFVPLTRDKWRKIRAMLQYHTSGGPPPLAEVGHNPLAAGAYLILYALLVIQCLTGIALLSMIADSGVLSALAGWVPRVLEPEYVRVTHHWLMFVFMAFAFGHICFTVLFARQARNGLITSMVSGWKLVPQTILNEEGTPPESPRVVQTKSGAGVQPSPLPDIYDLERIMGIARTEVPQPACRSSQIAFPN